MIELAAVIGLGLVATEIVLAGLEYELAAWDELEAVELEVAAEVAVDTAEVAVAAVWIVVV